MTTANSRSWLGKSWVFTAFALSGATLATAESSLAQILPDNTLGQERSVVIPLSPQVDRIDGGAMRGTSLFHSFSEFNIGEGRGAYFANPIGIETIFSRVTGSNPSNLLGTLGVLGDANLFFINPNGILFGPNASLDIRGSFVASTVSSVTLSNGSQFSATNPQAPPLLTVDVRAPIGLQFEGEQPGAIVNAGKLATGQNLTLVGGTVASTGQLSAPSGEVAAVTVEGASINSGMPVVQLSQAGQLLRQELQPLPLSSQAMSAVSLPEVIIEWGEQTGLRVNDSGQVEQISSGIPVEAGDVVVQQFNAQTATLSAANNLTLGQGYTGNVTIQATESIFFNEDSALFAGGDVAIQANNGNISFTDGAFVSAGSSGEADAGTVTIQANNGNISFTNKAYVSNLAQAQGNAGDVVIRANQGNISLTDAEIRANTLKQGNGGEVMIQAANGSVFVTNTGLYAITYGEGNGGNIAIQAAEEISVNGASSRAFTGSDRKNGSPLLGNSGNVDLRARSITISNDAGVQAGTAGQGKGGQITIQATDSVTVKNAAVETQTSGEGDAGSVRIQAGNSITIEGNESDSSGEGIFSGSRRLAGSPAILGNGGEVELSATSLFFNNGAILNVTTEGQGNGGSAVIQAKDSVFFTNGALVLADTISSGNAGNIFIQAHNTISGDNSTIFSRSRRQPGFLDPTGNGGEITLSARSIDFRNRAQVRADTEGSGTGGSITLQSMDTISFISNAALSSDTTGVGDGGRITIQSGDAVSLSDSAVVSARTLGAGKGGSITIQADGIFSVDDAQATVSSFESGDAGELDVDAKFVRLDNQGQLTATARVSNGGNIGLEVENILLMRRGSLISARSEGQNSRDGNIEINAGGIVAFPAENSDIIARSANRGDIDINAQAIFGFQVNEGLDAIPESELSATGNINLNLGVDPSRGLTTLPDEPRSTDVAEGCQASDGKDTVEYFDIGRGGTPPRPDEPLNADTVIAEWIPFDSEVAKENGQEGSEASNENAMHTAQEPTAISRLAPPCQNR